mgnify:FL=1
MIFIPIGILCVCFLLAFIMNQCRKQAEKRLFSKRARCTASAIATIQDIQRHHLRNHDRTTYVYYLVYQFYVNNTMIQAKSTIGVNPRNFSIGQLVTLFYNPSNPTEIHVPIENEEATAKNFKVATIVIIIAAVLAEIITLVGFTIIGWEVILS